MKKITISIFGNQVFSEILEELKIFPNSLIIFNENYNSDLKSRILEDEIIVFFLNEENKNDYYKIEKQNLPILLVASASTKIKKTNNFINQIITPFKILSFKSKITAILASNKFKKSSIIELGKYTINKNERKIIQGNLELKLTEKEIDFLILFTQQNRPIKKDFILKGLWNYSPETNTHTVETHIHRLRKKIFDKFQDSNFIKNNEKGYYI